METKEKIYIEKALAGTYERLTSSESGYPKIPFVLQKDVFMISAVLGARHGIMKPLTNKKDIFSWSTLVRDELAYPTLQAIAYNHTGDPADLTNEIFVLELAEQFANEGIHILEEKLLKYDNDEIIAMAMILLSEQP